MVITSELFANITCDCPPNTSGWVANSRSSPARRAAPPSTSTSATATGSGAPASIVPASSAAPAIAKR